jgi:hypothetical protein
MHYNLLFSGCSFTKGAELQGLEDDKEHQRTHRFSHLVADHFGKTYENIADSGASNDWIIEKTIKWFESGNTCDVAVIQFTHKQRVLWYDEITEECYNIFLAYANRLFSDGYLRKDSKMQFAFTLFYKHIYSDYLGVSNYYKNIFLLTNYLRSKNINYIFTTIEIFTNPSNTWKELCTSTIRSVQSILADDTRSNSYKEYYKKTAQYYCPDLKKYDEILNGTHPNELGHQKIAEYIIEEIRKNEYFI